jgi:hypothetical protein
MTEPHSTSLYSPAGRGILYIAPWDGTNPPDEGDYIDVGNCPSFEVEPSRETRPHYSSRSGLRTRDLNPTVQTEYNINFDLDEMAASNIARFFMGSLNATTKVIAALQNADAEYALKFVSDNPVGPNQTYYFWRVTLGPNGPLQLIGDEYLVMSFSGEGLADVANHAATPYFDIKNITTTTTTTTTTA